MQNLITKAKEALQPYQDPSGGYPDPSYILQLSDEIYSGSNLFAVQKTFDGPFQFDVFYESASAKEKLDCTCLDIACLSLH
jgi:mannosyl-oligosaccharide glucosidase